MHIAYSALSETKVQNPTAAAINDNEEVMLRIFAYQEVCAKYSKEIKAIRKYLPHWEPRFSCEEVSFE